MSGVDWEWKAFREPIMDSLEHYVVQARDAGFQHWGRIACPNECGTSYSLWIFTGVGLGSPSQEDRFARAAKVLKERLARDCSGHVGMYESK